jgi:hypothetical protein
MIPSQRVYRSLVRLASSGEIFDNAVVLMKSYPVKRDVCGRFTNIAANTLPSNLSLA